MVVEVALIRWKPCVMFEQSAMVQSGHQMLYELNDLLGTILVFRPRPRLTIACREFRNPERTPVKPISLFQLLHECAYIRPAAGMDGNKINPQALFDHSVTLAKRGKLFR